MIGIMHLVISRKGYGCSQGCHRRGTFFVSKKNKFMNQKRKKQLEFHMQNNELHAQIATVLELARENIVSKGWNKKHDKILKGIVEDLMFAHDSYETSFQSKKRKSKTQAFDVILA